MVPVGSLRNICTKKYFLADFPKSKKKVKGKSEIFWGSEYPLIWVSLEGIQKLFSKQYNNVSLDN